MHIGITESKTRKILEEEMAKTGLIDGDGLVLFGGEFQSDTFALVLMVSENAALPHGSGTDRVLGVNDLALIDAGGKWGGYVSDITRVSNFSQKPNPQVS
jgi:Xaa-Pro aminopeptidase